MSAGATIRRHRHSISETEHVAPHFALDPVRCVGSLVMRAVKDESSDHSIATFRTGTFGILLSSSPSFRLASSQFLRGKTYK